MNFYNDGWKKVENRQIVSIQGLQILNFNGVQC